METVAGSDYLQARHSLRFEGAEGWLATIRPSTGSGCIPFEFHQMAHDLELEEERRDDVDVDVFLTVAAAQESSKRLSSLLHIVDQIVKEHPDQPVGVEVPPITLELALPLGNTALPEPVEGLLVLRYQVVDQQVRVKADPVTACAHLMLQGAFFSVPEFTPAHADAGRKAAGSQRRVPAKDRIAATETLMLEIGETATGHAMLVAGIPVQVPVRLAVAVPGQINAAESVEITSDYRGEDAFHPVMVSDCVIIEKGAPVRVGDPQTAVACVTQTLLRLELVGQAGESFAEVPHHLRGPVTAVIVDNHYLEGRGIHALFSQGAQALRKKCGTVESADDHGEFRALRHIADDGAWLCDGSLAGGLPAYKTPMLSRVSAHDDEGV